MSEKKEKIIAAVIALLIGFIPVILDGDATFLLLEAAIMIGMVFTKNSDKE